MSDVTESFESLDKRLQEILTCTACSRLPKGAVYQCPQGHLICAGCFVHVVDEADRREQTAVCPKCSFLYSRRHVCRNFIVESAIAELGGVCRHCNKTYPRKSLEQHELTSCEEKLIPCRYKAIGCDWSGPARLRAAHEVACTVGQNELGPEVIKRLLDQKDGEKDEYGCVVDLLSSECVVSKDLQMKGREVENSEENLWETGPFWAFSNPWILQAKLSDTRKELAYELILAARETFPCSVSYVLLQGPYGDFKIEPKLVNFDFNDANTAGPEVVLPVYEETPSNLSLRVVTINVRLIMFLKAQ